MTNTISAENLGPISSLEFALQSPGVTVLVAPNGSGKSILLDAVQAAARGEGKLPLRDRARRGKVEAFGALITIGGTCRHTGGFEVSHLEGRFDLASLVDPRLKSPAAADKARIKALVALTGVVADSNLFKSNAAFEDFDEVVRASSLETDDLVEMGAKIKDDYDRAALAKENYGHSESGKATALATPADLDMDEECDAGILQTAYDKARDRLTRLEEQARNAKDSAKSIAESQSLLQRLGEDGLRADHKAISDEIKAASDGIKVKQSRIAQLKLEINQLETEITGCNNVVTTGEARLKTIAANIALVESAKATLAKSVTEMPDEQDIAEAQADVATASAAMDLGAKIRTAHANAAKSQAHRAAANEANTKAAKYRDAGKLTDEVLSATIKCPQLRVESDGKSARLVTDTTRGTSICYHDLSEGERWTIAIDIGAEQVGAGGLLVISQVGWEGIDGANRIAIHQHAMDKGVYILTAEAASDPTAKKEIKPLPLDQAEEEQVRGNRIGAEQARKNRDERNAARDAADSAKLVNQLDSEYRETLKDLPEGEMPQHVLATPSPVTPPVTSPVNPPPKKPPAKPPAPTPPPAAEADDFDEVPF